MKNAIDLTDIDYVKALQSNIRATLDTPQGMEVMQFLESLCGWYDFSETHPDLIMIKNGKRQVLATLKTLMRVPAEQIVLIANQLTEE